jgi:hypothetical protein
MSPALNGIVRWGPIVLLIVICTLLLQVPQLFGMIILYSLYCITQFFSQKTVLLASV